MQKTFTVVMLFLVGLATRAQTPPQTPVPADYFGMHLGYPMDWPTVSVGALGKGTGVGWPYIEQPSKGSYNWTRLDGHVQLAQNHRVHYLAALGGCPCWAAPPAAQARCKTLFTGQRAWSGMVNDIQDWDDFITALVTHLKNKFPAVVDYELWNEPDQGFTGTIADMVMLTTHAYNIIRRIDPSAKIVAPSYTNPENLDAYYGGGGVRGVDVNSLHGYPDPKNDVPEAIGGFLSVPYKVVFTKYGIQNKPLWDTEGSWGNESVGAITDSNQQVAFVARYYLLHWSNGFTRLNWYAWEDSPGGWGFLLNASTHTLSPAATAFQQTYNWMVGATMPSPGCVRVSSSSSSYDAMWTCSLTRSGGYKALAVWNTAGPSSYTPSSGYTQYRDLTGRVSRVIGPITIGVQPVLLEADQPMPPAGLTATVN